MDLFREILLEVEKQPVGASWNATPLLDHSLQEVVAHLRLIQDAGLIDARFLNAVQNDFAHVIRITNEGFDFLEASRQPTMWEKAKQQVKSAGVPVTVYALKLAVETIIKNAIH